MLLKAVRQWFDDKTPTMGEDQSRIGVYGLLKGYICSELTAQQQRYIDKWSEKNETKHETGAQWTSRLILFMWDEAHELWMERNASTHEKPNVRKELEAKITALYQDKENVTARDRNLIFGRELDDLLKENDHHLNAWLSAYAELIKHSTNDAKEQAIANVPKITEFFSRVTKP